MNLQQLIQLVLFTSLVMLPLGMFSGSAWRWLKRRVGRWLPPRYLRRGPVRIRSIQSRGDRDGTR